jgi:hypothetical protein
LIAGRYRLTTLDDVVLEALVIGDRVTDYGDFVIVAEVSVSGIVDSNGLIPLGALRRIESLEDGRVYEIPVGARIREILADAAGEAPADVPASDEGGEPSGNAAASTFSDETLGEEAARALEEAPAGRQRRGSRRGERFSPVEEG